jgi:hypothetical protein
MLDTGRVLLPRGSYEERLHQDPRGVIDTTLAKPSPSGVIIVGK